MTDPNPTIFVIQHQGSQRPLGQGEVALLWDQFESSDTQISLPLETEKHVEDIRRDFLDVIEALGEFSVSGKSLADHLKVAPGLSLWHLGLIFESSPIKSPRLYDVFKLRALDKILENKKVERLIYAGSDTALKKTLQTWCQENSWAFSWEQASAQKQGLYSRLPHFLQGLVYWGYKLKNVYRFSLVRKKNLSDDAKDLTIFTYFPNINLDKAKEGEFYSNYFKSFHDLIKKTNTSVHWVWLYTNSNQLSLQDSLALQEKLQHNPKHRFDILTTSMGLIEFLSMPFRLLGTWFKSRKLVKTSQGFKFHNSRLNFYPLLKSDFLSSIGGKKAMENLLMVQDFRSFFANNPAHNKAIVVWENQPWERVATQTLKNAVPEAPLFAYQHAALSPLDLRLSKINVSSEYEIRPRYLANGEGSVQAFLNLGYQAEQLQKVEALRYLGLKPQTSAPTGKNLLVVTGIDFKEASDQIRILVEAAQLGALENIQKVIIKPHPFCPLDELLKSLAPTFDYEIVSTPLPALWPEAAAAFVGNWTSTGIEALINAIPTAVCLRPTQINLSPLVNYDVPMVFDGTSLKDFLQKGAKGPDLSDYFDLSPELTAWQTKVLEATSAHRP